MRVRSQLAIAFFFLAVLPLAGITLYSYYSSIEAFRLAVETESHQTASEMRGRMESVRRQLARRIRSINVGPFQRLMAEAGENALDEKVGGEIYSSLVGNLGDLAPMLDSLEIAPAQQAGKPQPGVGQAERLEPDAGESIRAFSSRQDERRRTPPGPADFSEELRFEVPGRAELIVLRRPAPPPPTPETAQAPRQDGRFRELVVRMEEKAAEQLGAAERQSAEFAEMAREAILHERFRKEEQKEQTERIECLDLTSEIRLPWMKGRPEGEEARIVAQVNAKRMLGTVLSRVSRGQGGIPFARDVEGRLYTLRAEDVQQLASLQDKTSDFEQLEPVQDDWLVVMQRDDPTGTLFGIARPLGEGLGEIRRTAVRNLGFGTALIGLALLGIFPLSNRITRNLASLTAGAEKLARGDLKTRVSVRSRDEFGQLSETFNRMAQELENHQAELVQQERLRKELEMCRQIQTEMLPKHPLRLAFAEAQGLSIPAREVGGDFFNYFPLHDGQVALLIGDVSGKGVAAALLMANLQATLQARLTVSSELREVVQELDQEIYESTPRESFVTLFLAILSPDGRKLRWLSAGHNTQYLLRGGGRLECLSSSGRPLGLLPGSEYTEESLELRDGDSLFLYTDGLVEAESESGEEFGNSRLEEILRKHQTGDSASLLTAVESVAREYRGSAERGDDATMLVLKTTSRA